MGELQAPVSGGASLPLQHPFMLSFGLPASYGASEQEGGKGFFCGLYLYPAHVDELLTPHPGMADSFGAKGRVERSFDGSAFTYPELNQYSLCHYFGYGL